MTERYDRAYCGTKEHFRNIHCAHIDPISRDMKFDRTGKPIKSQEVCVRCGKILGWVKIEAAIV